MNSSQRKDVACEILNFGFAKPSPEDIWDPENEDWQWRMLVEWLADRMYDQNFDMANYRDYAVNILSAIHERNVADLELAVFNMLQLKDQPNGR
jgi:hypothetical protein